MLGLCARDRPLHGVSGGGQGRASGRVHQGIRRLLGVWRESVGDAVAMRVSEHRVLVVAMVLLMVAVIGWFEGFLPSATPSVDSFCRGVSNPSQNVVLCEDFEDDAVNTRWDIGSNRGLLSASRFVRCDDDFGFHDRCAAWRNQLVFDNAWGFYGYDGRRAFTPQSEFYVRWYQYVELGLRRKDRKSTRLNSSHVRISYAVFCLKKK